MLSHEIGVAVLPAVKVHMASEVLVPRVLHCRLERHHEDTLGPHALGELVGREGLAETHLGVPQEARHSVGVFCPDRLVIVDGLLHRSRLLWTHWKGLVVATREDPTFTQFRNRRKNVARLAPYPL